MSWNIYIRKVLISVTLVVGFLRPSMSFAQSSSTLTPTAKLHVGVGLWISNLADLDFGTVIAGTGPHSIPLAGATEGKVQVGGKWNKSINVTVSPPPYISNASVTDSMAYTPGAAYNNYADDPATATVWTSLSGTLTGCSLRAGHVGGSATGYAFIYIFGTIEVHGNALPGLYTGNFTIQVAY